MTDHLGRNDQRQAGIKDGWVSIPAWLYAWHLMCLTIVGFGIGFAVRAATG